MGQVLLALMFAFPASVAAWSPATPLPEPVSNNAVASVVHEGRVLLFSLMGIGEKKAHDAIVRDALVYDSKRRRWLRLPPVPGEAGRIAASAVAIHGKVYLLGGYTVDAQKAEVSLANVDIYTPGHPDAEQGHWSKGIPMPVPVDDAVAGVYRNRYLVLISGWSQKDNVADVQVYDTLRDRWHKGTAIPGTPVFGHAGAIAGKTIVYCGGAYKNPAWAKENGQPRYVTSDACWEGTVTSRDAARIEWKRLDPHPGRAQYRMAAGPWRSRIIFAGGTDNPYNYDGQGYDGKPAEPVATTFAWETHSHAWEQLPDDPAPTMDHRGLVADRDGLLVVGGLEKDQKVTRRVSRLAVSK